MAAGATGVGVAVRAGGLAADVAGAATNGGARAALDTGVPVIFLNHLAAEVDRWDPRVLDGIAAKYRVIACTWPS